MSEGAGLEGLIGVEPESAESPAAPASADPVAMAVAVDAAKHDPDLARKAGNYLDEQLALVRLQVKHFDEEHRLSIAAAKRKRFADRIRNTISAGFLVLLCGVLLGIAWMIINAVHSREVVIAPFTVAPVLAEQGATGEIVAAGVLDELTRIQAATRSSTQKSELSNAWNGNIKIEVADTGFSISELLRLLRQRLGHDVRVEGDLVPTPGHGLALTVRGSGVAPKTFAGGAAELNKLIRGAAEYVFAQSRPALWAAYLVGNGRNDETIEFARAAVPRSDKIERARLVDMWANALANSGRYSEGLAMARASVAINPEDWGARDDVIAVLFFTGEEEEAWRASEEMRHLAGGRPGRAPEIQYQNWDQMTWNLPSLLAVMVADLDATAGAGTNFGPQWVYIPLVTAQMHDPEAADLALTTASYKPADPLDQSALHWAEAVIADERGHTAEAAQQWQQALVGYERPLIQEIDPAMPCFAAVAYEHAARPDDADRALASVKLKFVDCERFRGDILDGRGDWPGAQKAYASAVELAPDLPAGYFSWGVALAKHGDLVGAIAKLTEANQRGPHWADPLKTWADVFIKQGKAQEALAKCDEALKYAPNWKQLKETRETLTKQKN